MVDNVNVFDLFQISAQNVYQSVSFKGGAKIQKGIWDVKLTRNELLNVSKPQQAIIMKPTSKIWWTNKDIMIRNFQLSSCEKECGAAA